MLLPSMDDSSMLRMLLISEMPWNKAFDALSIEAKMIAKDNDRFVSFHI